MYTMKDIFQRSRCLMIFVIMINIGSLSCVAPLEKPPEPVTPEVYEGEEAIRELKKYKYVAKKIDDGYKLTKSKTEYRIVAYKGRTVKEPFEVDVFKTILLNGTSELLKPEGVTCGVNDEGIIWIAVPKRVFYDQNNPAGTRKIKIRRIY